MSVNATKWVWDQMDLASSEKFVLLRLADHADPDGGSVRPGIASVAAHTGLGERQVQRYIKSFVNRGYLAIEANEKGGRGKTTEYRFTFLNPVTGDIHTTHETPSPVTPILEEKGDMEGQQRVTPVTVKGDIHACADLEPSRTVNEPTPIIPPKKTESIPFLMLDALCETLNVDVSMIQGAQKARQLAVAKRLFEAGVTVQDVCDMTSWLQSQSWVTGGIDMFLLEKQLTKWHLSGKPTDIISARSGPSLPSWVTLLPGEKPESLGDGKWDLIDGSGLKRSIRPSYYGVIWDERQHRYADGQKEFARLVTEAKRLEGVA